MSGWLVLTINPDGSLTRHRVSSGLYPITDCAPVALAQREDYAKWVAFLRSQRSKDASSDEPEYWSRNAFSVNAERRDLYMRLDGAIPYGFSIRLGLPDREAPRAVLEIASLFDTAMLGCPALTSDDGIQRPPSVRWHLEYLSSDGFGGAGSQLEVDSEGRALGGTIVSRHKESWGGRFTLTDSERITLAKLFEPLLNGELPGKKDLITDCNVYLRLRSYDSASVTQERNIYPDCRHDERSPPVIAMTDALDAILKRAAPQFNHNLSRQ